MTGSLFFRQPLSSASRREGLVDISPVLVVYIPLSPLLSSSLLAGQLLPTMSSV